MVSRRPPGSFPDAIDRRTFLAAAPGAVILTARAPHADLTIGLVVPAGPLAGPLQRGAEMGVAEANQLAQMFEKTIAMEAPRVSDPGGAAKAAAELLDRGVRVLVGGADEEQARALGAIAGKHSALFMNVGCGADSLRATREPHMFHLHASLEMHVGAAAHWLAEDQKLKKWSVVGPDRVARQVEAAAARRGAEVVAQAAFASGARAPESLQAALSARPNALWISAAKGDVRGLLEAVKAAAFEGAIVGIEPDGAGLPGIPGLIGVWPAMWHYTLEKFSGRELNGRYTRRFNERLDGPAWSAWAAFKMAGEALLRSGPSPQALIEFFESSPPFDGHKGRALTFRKWDHQLRHPMYLVRSKDEADGEVVAEVPKGDMDAIVAGPARAPRAND